MLNDFQHPLKLCLFYEFFFAFWAGDTDFALAPGYTDLLAAAGTVVVFVLLILQSLQKQKILLVFLVAFIDIPGKTTENGPTHKSIGKQHQNQIHGRQLHKHIDCADHKAGTQNQYIQLVGTVAAQHKMP